MHSTVEKLNLIKKEINEIVNKKQLKISPQIIVVTKTFPMEKITSLLNFGHNHFGENKIQEAEKKWSELKNKNNLYLHMVGKVQSNKAKKAVKVFDFIHSLDNKKLALKLNESEIELNKKVKYFIQVNIANETQKSGINLNEINEFYTYCTKELSLNIVGLMCLPPANIDPDTFFKLLKNEGEKLKIKELSMGMSGDYKVALINGSTYLRLGSKIMGERKSI
jgi:pyridoxal phosphate enzyme (YggS family)